LSEDGGLIASSGNGGVATALTSLVPLGDLVWVASAMTDGDRRMARSSASPLKVGDNCCYQRLVALPRSTYHLYYGVFSNPTLWFLQHSLWRNLKRPHLDRQMRRAWEQGYLPANRAFAQAIVDELDRDPSPAYVMVQDYHLYMCPACVREMAPDVLMQHFIHIPWPAAGVWEQLPREFVQAICRSLLCADLVGFQTEVSARNFLLTCKRFLSEVTVDSAAHSVASGNRWTDVRVYPVSVDVERLVNQTRSLDFARHRRRLESMTSKYTIVKVDRVDPSKNVIGGLDAFNLLLRQHPELHGEVKLLAFLVPSRDSVPEFRRHAKQVFRRIEQVNKLYARRGWKPIEVFGENNYLQALAGMSLYDVLLVNSLADGMNLVSKEGPIVHERNGVLILSTEVGAHAELCEGALSVAATDIGATADALWRGLTMPEDEKRRRVRDLRQVIAKRDLRDWLRRQSEDLDGLAGERDTNITEEAQPTILVGHPTCVVKSMAA
jgi:trehalose 6-phosphate synthase